MPFHYRPDILEDLCSHGIRPTADTDPAFVREYLSDLYRYEIRRLKGRLVRGDFPQRDYAPKVRALRNAYFLLAIPVDRWVERAG